MSVELDAVLAAGFGQGFGCGVEVEVAQGVFQPRGVVGKGRLEKSGAHTAANCDSFGMYLSGVFQYRMNW